MTVTNAEAAHAGAPLDEGLWKVISKADLQRDRAAEAPLVRVLQPGHVFRGRSAPGSDWIEVLARPGAEGGWVNPRAYDRVSTVVHEVAKFRVAHKAVMVRASASLSAKVKEIKKQGDVLAVEGHLDGWLKVVPGESCGSSGWCLLKHPEYGVLVQHSTGQVPTFSGSDCLTGHLDATPPVIYGDNRHAGGVAEEMKAALSSVRKQIAEREDKAAAAGERMHRESEVLRKGLMAGSGQMSKSGFYVGGEPV